MRCSADTVDAPPPHAPSAAALGALSMLTRSTVCERELPSLSAVALVCGQRCRSGVPRSPATQTLVLHRTEAACCKTGQTAVSASLGMSRTTPARRTD